MILTVKSLIKNLNKNKILFYGYGNPGRQDDGLGVFFIDELIKYIKKNRLKNIYFDTNYQLNIEDALEISKYDSVIFIDAAKKIKKSFNFKKIKPLEINFYTTHNMLPENILFLCIKLYDKKPDAYLLTIKGYKWGVNEKPTEKALKNLKNALIYIKKLIKILYK